MAVAENPGKDSAPEGTESHDPAYPPKFLEFMRKGWRDTEHDFDRLPAKAKDVVREAVWDLSRHSAGLSVRFTTNATRIRMRWTVTEDRLALPHMPATGVSGLDLYAREGSTWYFVGGARPTETPTNATDVIVGLTPSTREFRAYLPLYNGVSTLEIGVPEDASFRFEPPSTGRPIVIYGTSITQGCCASRPGMAYPAMLGRLLDETVINLGFSGNGKAEPEMARLLAELDPAVFVLDALPNLTPAQVVERMPLPSAWKAEQPKSVDRNAADRATHALCGPRCCERWHAKESENGP